MDKKKLKELFLLYNYKVEKENDDYIAFSYLNPYPAVEIIPLKDLGDKLTTIKSSFSQAGFAVSCISKQSLNDLEQYLFDLFFHVEAANERNREKYKKYTNKVMEPYNSKITKTSNAALKQYEYINIDYKEEMDFEDQVTSMKLIDSIINNIQTNGPKLIIVEAAAGFGKTSTAYELLNRLSNSKEKNRPFFMELFKDRSASTFRYLLLSQIEYNFDITLKANVVIHNIQKGRIPLILDGFDELLSRDLDNGNDNLSFDDVESMLSTIADLLQDQAKVILTTRKTAIFTGESFYDWYLKHTEKQTFQVCRYQLKEPLAENWLSISRLNKVNRNIISSLENPVLLGYLRYADEETFKDINTSSSLLHNYFDFLLKREIERQDLPFNTKEQMLIFEGLASGFAGLDITSESRNYVKNIISEISFKLIESRATINKDSQNLINTLTNHALLDRKDNGNVGFINDFIFINLLALAIKEVNDYDIIFYQKEIGSVYIEKIISAASSWSQTDRVCLYNKLSQRCKMNPSLNFLADIKLYNKIHHKFDKISFDALSIKDSSFGSEKFILFECTFSNIKFISCFFDFNFIENCTFINCKFSNDCIKDGSNDNCEFYNCKDDAGITGQTDDENNNLDEDDAITIKEFNYKILSKYFRVDNRTRRMRMISKLRNGYDGKLFKKYFNFLIANKYIKLNGDKSFITNEGINFYNTLNNE